MLRYSGPCAIEVLSDMGRYIMGLRNDK